MKISRVRSFVLAASFLGCILAYAKVFSQPLDPYRRINDPLAIANLGGPDSGQTIYDYKGSSGPRDTDGYQIQSSATGAGIIRHLWVVYNGGGDPDSDYLKLWVDDSLLISGTAPDFFSKVHGLIGAPFDTSSSGAEVCETQIPYHRNFRWTTRGEWHFSGCAWQPIDTTKTTLPSLSSPAFRNDQLAAD